MASLERLTLPVIMATMVFVIRRLSLSFWYVFSGKRTAVQQTK